MFPIIRSHPSSRCDFCILMSDNASEHDILLMKNLVDFLETPSSGEKLKGWYRHRDALPGQNKEQGVTNAVNESDVVILFIGKFIECNYQDRIKQTYDAMLSKRQPNGLIPVFLDEKCKADSKDQIPQLSLHESVCVDDDDWKDKVRASITQSDIGMYT